MEELNLRGQQIVNRYLWLMVFLMVIDVYGWVMTNRILEEVQDNGNLSVAKQASVLQNCKAYILDAVKSL